MSVVVFYPFLVEVRKKLIEVGRLLKQDTINVHGTTNIFLSLKTQPCAMFPSTLVYLWSILNEIILLPVRSWWRER